MDTNWMHWLTKRISHNPWIFLWVVACAVVLWLAYGCESKVAVDGQKLTRQEVITIAHRAETDYLQNRADLLAKIASLDAKQQRDVSMTEMQIAELDRQDEMKAQLLEGGVTLIEKYAPGQVADITKTIVGLIAPAGIGAFYLNGRRKDKIIKGNGGTSTPPPT